MATSTRLPTFEKQWEKWYGTKDEVILAVPRVLDHVTTPELWLISFKKNPSQLLQFLYEFSPELIGDPIKIARSDAVQHDHVWMVLATWGDTKGIDTSPLLEFGKSLNDVTWLHPDSHGEHLSLRSLREQQRHAQITWQRLVNRANMIVRRTYKGREHRKLVSAKGRKPHPLRGQVIQLAIDGRTRDEICERTGLAVKQISSLVSEARRTDPRIPKRLGKPSPPISGTSQSRNSPNRE